MLQERIEPDLQRVDTPRQRVENAEQLLTDFFSYFLPKWEDISQPQQRMFRFRLQAFLLLREGDYAKKIILEEFEMLFRQLHYYWNHYVCNVMSEEQRTEVLRSYEDIPHALIDGQTGAPVSSEIILQTMGSTGLPAGRSVLQPMLNRLIDDQVAKSPQEIGEYLQVSMALFAGMAAVRNFIDPLDKDAAVDISCPSASVIEFPSCKFNRFELDPEGRKRFVFSGAQQRILRKFASESNYKCPAHGADDLLNNKKVIPTVITSFCRRIDGVKAKNRYV